jgi:anti-sigma B factor antagonist
MSQPESHDPYAVEKGAADPAAGASGASSNFSVSLRDGIHVINFSRGDVLDAYYIEQLGEDLVDYAKKNDSARILVDMASINHLSSAALGMLVTLKSNVDAVSGRLCLSGIQHDLMQIFKLTKLNKVLEIHETLDGALAAMK